VDAVDKTLPYYELLLIFFCIDKRTFISYGGGYFYKYTTIVKSIYVASKLSRRSLDRGSFFVATKKHRGDIFVATKKLRGDISVATKRPRRDILVATTNSRRDIFVATNQSGRVAL
jgi:hypothetical protein